MEFKVTKCIATIEGVLNCNTVYDSDDFPPELMESLSQAGYIEDTGYIADSVAQSLSITDLADVGTDIIGEQHKGHVLKISDEGTTVVCGKIKASELEDDFGIIHGSELGNYVTLDYANTNFVTWETMKQYVDEAIQAAITQE